MQTAVRVPRRQLLHGQLALRRPRNGGERSGERRFAAVGLSGVRDLSRRSSHRHPRVTPMTYNLDGKQYIVVAVGGGTVLAELLAFALPD